MCISKERVNQLMTPGDWFTDGCDLGSGCRVRLKTATFIPVCMRYPSVEVVRGIVRIEVGGDTLWLQIPKKMEGHPLDEWAGMGFRPVWTQNRLLTVNGGVYGKNGRLGMQVIPQDQCLGRRDGTWVLFTSTFRGLFEAVEMGWKGDGQRVLGVDDMTVLANAISRFGIELCIGWEEPVPFSDITKTLVPARLGVLQKIANQIGF